MRGLKSDYSAREVFGLSYDAIPKSAFALMAFHLASLCGEDEDEGVAAFNRLIEEAEALGYNGIMPEKHVQAVRKALT